MSLPTKKPSILILTLTLLLGGTTGSSGGASAMPSADGNAMQRTADALARVDDSRSLLRSGGIADAIRAASALGDIDLNPVQSGPRTRLRGLPRGFAAPVGELVAAVQRAEAIVAEATDPRAAAAARRMLGLAGRVGLEDPDHLAAWLDGIEQGVRWIDMDAFASAALHVAVAIDRAMSVLRPVGPRRDVAGCDVAEHPGLLCIGGDGPNVYDKDYAVLIDLGGDDVYTNRAGTGFALHPVNSAPGQQPVAVNLDLGGNDRYERDVPKSVFLLEIAQGSGYMGIGMLVDAGGDDVYAIRTAPLGSSE